MSDLHTDRIISHAEAREVAQRLIDGAFRNSDKPRPRFSIPADKDRDDDLLISAYIAQQAAKDRASTGEQQEKGE